MQHVWKTRCIKKVKASEDMVLKFQEIKITSGFVLKPWVFGATLRILWVRRVNVYIHITFPIFL